MNIKTFRPRLSRILMLFALSFLFNLLTQAQQINYSARSTNDLYNDFEVAQKLPCGKRDEAIVIGKEIIKRFDDGELNNQTNKQVVDWAKKEIFVIEEEDKACRIENSLDTLYANYKTAKKLPCGDRTEAILIGKRIIEEFSDDTLNRDVIDYVKKDSEKTVEQDRKCKRDQSYNKSYKNKNWGEFFAISKQIITEEGDNPIALDVMLTLVSVGSNLTIQYKNDTYNSDTVFFAKKAIELIENGTKTQARWGVFQPYEIA